MSSKNAPVHCVIYAEAQWSGTVARVGVDRLVRENLLCQVHESAYLPKVVGAMRQMRIEPA
jgi:hypothetical protein